jgi:hypothetical protein
MQLFFHPRSLKSILSARWKIFEKNFREYLENRIESAYLCIRFSKAVFLVKVLEGRFGAGLSK